MKKRVSICIITIAILLFFICFFYIIMRNAGDKIKQDNTQNESEITESVNENIHSEFSASTEGSVNSEGQAGFEDSTNSEDSISAENSVSSEITVSAEANSSAKYIILARSGTLVVFYSDGTTEYFDTGIEVMSLPEETIDQVVEGIPFTSEEELFAFLESYSS